MTSSNIPSNACSAARGRPPLVRVRYNIFDLRTGKYWSKSELIGQVVLQDFAGIFDPAELDAFLIAKYHTADRVKLATQITVVLIG